MRILLILCVIAFGGLTAGMLHAHDDHDQNPGSQVYLQFEITLKGDLHSKLKEEFAEELETTGAGAVFGIHKVDLNADGQNEYIVRFMDEYMSCNDTGCHHAIVAEKPDGSIHRLLYVGFSEIKLSIERTKNVTDILVYDDPLNDFEAKMYKWDAESQTYKRDEA